MITTTRERPPRSTPWGAIQSEREEIPGCWWITTAGHGGYWLTADRARKLGECFPRFRRNRWFEEDCDWSLVVLAFQAEFPKDATVHHAVEMVQMCAGMEFCKAKWQPILDWLENTEAGGEVMARYNRHAADVATKWRTGSLCSINRREFEASGMSSPPERYFQVSVSRGSTRRSVIMPYPRQEYFTDAELSAVEFHPEPLRPEPAPRKPVHPVDGWRAEPRDLPGNGQDEHEPAGMPGWCEPDYGGAFDGFTVTSDADPGL